MTKIKVIACFFVIGMLLVVYTFSHKQEKDFSIIMASYTENGSYIEYPQIQGLEDNEKQIRINNLLKNQVYFGAKSYFGDSIVDFSNPNYVYEFKCGVGLKNQGLASFWYNYDAYGEVHFSDGSVLRDTSRFFGVTINMQVGEIIDLQDFMVIDERLINCTDGSNDETDYKSAVKPTFRKFKDVFMVYTSEQKKDNHHKFTPHNAIDLLKNPNGETIWYINEHKQIVFLYSDNSIAIPYSEVEELIYPQYLSILKR